MAIERKRYAMKSTQPDLTKILLFVPVASGAFTSTGMLGDTSLVTSVTDGGTGLVTIVFKQVGYSLVGASCNVLCASPGTTAIKAANIKSFTSSTKTLVCQTYRPDTGAVGIPANSDGIWIELSFRDSIGL